jgi:hypothetical protein
MTLWIDDNNAAAKPILTDELTKIGYPPHSMPLPALLTAKCLDGVQQRLHIGETEG